jgi:predicted Co/Zn/Cd cation transporter (cation efflux family)
MPQPPPSARQIERRSLQIGVAASLLMAAMGISVYALSGSEALLLDGLYSGLMAASSFIAARIGANVVRPPDRAYPYGYDGQESLYVLFRSLVLIGILSVAVITAGTTIVNHLAGQTVAAVQLRPVAAYAGLMVVLCLALAWRHERDWKRSGRCSELLRTEAHAARVDGLISAVAGAALLGAPLLQSTPLRPLVPVADSVLVLLLALAVVPEPLQQFWRALRQAAGAACDPALITRTRAAVQELLSGMSAWLLDLTVMKVGRTTFVVAYLNPAMPVDGPWIDRLRERIDARCAELLGPVRTEVIVTGQAPFAA